MNRLREYRRGTLASGGGSVAVPITLPGTDSIRSYDLDDLGNWSSTTYTPAGGSSTTETRQHNLLNQVTAVDSTALNYDANGNLTDDGTRICRYDALNRLKQVLRKSGSVLVAEYAYDALGRRIRKVVSNGGLGGTIPNGTTDYLYADQQSVEERNGSDAATRQFVWGIYIDELIQLKTYVASGPQNLSAGAYWSMQDLHYRVTALSDASRAIVEAYDLDPYGRRLAFSGPGADGIWFSNDDLAASYAACQHGHQGLLHDEESGLVCNRARMLHSLLGRFMQRDPLGYTDGMNLYEYTHSRPINTTDWSGTYDVGGPGNPGEGFTIKPKCCGQEYDPETQCCENNNIVDKVSIWVCKSEFAGVILGPISHSFIACDDPIKNPSTREKYGKWPDKNRGKKGKGGIAGPGYILKESFDPKRCKERRVCPADKERMCKEGPTEDPYFLLDPCRNCHGWAKGRSH